MHAIVHSADIQDRDGGALLMASLFGAFPFLIKLYADGVSTRMCRFLPLIFLPAS